MIYCKSKLKSNAGRVSPCFRLLYVGNAWDRMNLLGILDLVRMLYGILS
jgi:hypothetical protein